MHDILWCNNCIYSGKSPVKVPLSFIYKIPSADRLSFTVHLCNHRQSSQLEIKPGDEIEVYTQLSSTVSSFPANSNWSIDEKELYSTLALSPEMLAWWPAFVQNIRGEYLVVRIAGISGFKDVVERSIVRMTGDKSLINRKPLDESSFFKRAIDIPPELAYWLVAVFLWVCDWLLRWICSSKDISVHKDLLRHCTSSATMHYDEESLQLAIYAFDSDVIRQVDLLEDTHLRMLRQKWTLMQSVSQATKRLQVIPLKCLGFHPIQFRGHTLKHCDHWIHLL